MGPIKEVFKHFLLSEICVLIGRDEKSPFVILLFLEFQHISDNGGVSCS